MSTEEEVDFLGTLPLESRIRADVDEGKPTVVSDPEGRVAQIYRDIARRATAKLSRKSKEYASVFPSISISN
jgi:ATP-binding protein involved in chromosome partitioning